MKVSDVSLGSAARLCQNYGRAVTVSAWQRRRMRSCVWGQRSVRVRLLCVGGFSGVWLGVPSGI
eukprot:6040072-Ditylum_brightwellii.AAC.1